MLQSYLAFLTSLARKLVFNPNIDLDQLRKLEASLYHSADGCIGYALGAVDKIGRGDGSSDSVAFLVKSLQRLNQMLNERRSSLFRVAPRKKTVLCICTDLEKLDTLATKIGSAKDGTQVAEFAQEAGRVSLRLKGNLNRLFKKDTVTLLVPLSQVARTAVSNVRSEKEPVMKEFRIQIRDEYEAESSAARVSFEDYHNWRDILDNLLRNAVEAVESLGAEADNDRERRTVSLAVTTGEKKDDLCRIVVRDRGVGMSPEILRSFWRRGYSKGKPQGHGLGITEDKIDFIRKVGRLDVESAQGEGTTFRITVRRGSRTASRSYASVKLRATQTAILAALVVTAAVIASSFFQPPEPNPRRVEKGENYVRILGDKDELISQHNFPVNIIAGEECWEIVDLDGDSKNEVFFAVWTENRLDTLNGTLICYDNSGKERWRTKAIQRTAYLGDSTHFAYHNTFVDVYELAKDAGLTIVTSYHADFPARQQIKSFSAEGDLIGEYFHQGVLGERLQLDVDKDGWDEIILAGTNNQLAGAVIVVVDPENLTGVSPPHTGERSIRFQAGKMPKGTAKYYIRLPLTDFCKRTKSDGSCCVELLRLSDSTFKAGTQEHPFEQVSGMHYFFNGLHVTSVGFGPQFENLWRTMGTNLDLPLSNIREYCEQLKCGVEYYDGEHWVARPCINKNYLELVEQKGQPRAVSNPQGGDLP